MDERSGTVRLVESRPDAEVRGISDAMVEELQPLITLGP